MFDPAYKSQYHHLTVQCGGTRARVCMYLSPFMKVKGLRLWATQIAIEVRPAMLEHRQMLAQLLQ